MYWQELTRPGLETFDRNTPVILPVAAIEQHGPHLPLATDRIINEHLCGALDQAAGDQVLILPTMPVGCSRHHMDFVGTLTLTHETFITVAKETLECVASHGFT
ncbi:MAG: creatininase family protein, partial [Planctomycetota bacterium]